MNHRGTSLVILRDTGQSKTKKRLIVINSFLIFLLSNKVSFRLSRDTAVLLKTDAAG